MSILLVGKDGFLGKSIAEYLSAERLPFYAVGRQNSQPSIDLCNPKSLLQLNSFKIDTVINAAAVTPGPGKTDPALYFNVNTLGQYNLLKWCAEGNVGRYVGCSTLAVCGRPWPVPFTEDHWITPIGAHAAYAMSKLSGEVHGASFAQENNIRWANLRFSALYGCGMPWHGVLADFIDKALRGERLRVFANGEIYADFLHVADAAKHIVHVATCDCTGTINSASGTESSLVDLARLCLQAAGRATNDVEILRNGLPQRAVIDTSRLESLLSPLPARSIEAGIHELVNWRRANLS